MQTKKYSKETNSTHINQNDGILVLQLLSLTLCCLQGSRFFKRKWNKYDQILIYFCSKYCSLDLLLRKSCILRCVCLFYFFTLVAMQLHQKKNCQQKFVAHCMLPTNIRDKIMTEVFNVCHGKLALTKGSQWFLQHPVV